MILAAGLTPAWQQTLVFSSCVAGEVNRATEAVWCASGKVLNVGIALRRLGADSLTLSCAGGWPAAALRSDLEQLDVQQRWVTTQCRSRVCTTILDRSKQQTTELVENAAPLTPDELALFRKVYLREAEQCEVVVLSGSLPAETPATYYRELLQGTGSRTVLDIRGPELLQALECRPFLVKPNRQELESTLGRSLTTDAELVSGMRELVQRGARWVLVTHGASSVWLVSEADAWRWTPLRVPVVNPIGCGDSLAAGVAVGLDRGLSVVEAVRLGLAAAADNAGQFLPARIDAARVEQLLLSIPGPTAASFR